MLEFSLTGTVDTEDEITIELTIDGDTVAETTLEGSSDSTHFSLIYRGRVSSSSGVEVVATGDESATFPAMGL